MESLLQSTFLEIFSNIPIPASVKNKLVPPEEINGSEIPLVGSCEGTTLMLKKACSRPRTLGTRRQWD
jgi:hypothetical protein